MRPRAPAKGGVGGYRSGGGKRAFDLAVSIPAFVVSLPIQAAVALAVRRKLGHPVLFSQERPGMHGTVFVMHKFRTMLPVDPARGWVTDEERMVPFGAWLRSTSLDELPTLLNVIKGDMSLVGPRPLLVEYLDRYSKDQARRHEVRPGLTGLAQVEGRNALSWDERFAFDLKYIDEMSLLADLRILLRTVAAVVQRRGISAEGVATMTRFTGSEPSPTALATPQDAEPAGRPCAS